MSLEPIDAESALELYLTDRATELSEASLKSHEYQLKHFIRWCDEQEIENLNSLGGRDLQRFRLWRREDGDLNKVSERSQMNTFRVFIRWLESMDGVEQDLSQKVMSPSLTPDENARDVMLDSDRAPAVLAHLEKYEYATVPHVAISLMWHTMMRVGGVHALDVDDYSPDDQCVEVQHRPDTGTPIKNQSKGERLVALSDQVCDLLDDWLSTQRPDVTDEYGRTPLLASRQGRTKKSTLRSYVYRWTRPCVYDDECPHDRNPDECEAMTRDSASRCPSSVSPHAIRRGSITHSLNNNMPDKVVSDRANVSQRVLDKHYDRRTDREKMEQRREYLDNI
ncbi:tyrosine-type recombinase/integrase [Halobellus marinus]|uniref:tyrosine-type recombinase/integrase n=1 Tax=Halobellus TaxID=1073986 RepID=UPI0028A72FA3|nr:tyrosine-type recombinase/integrase [Halobellus sp. DFY28]